MCSVARICITLLLSLLAFIITSDCTKDPIVPVDNVPAGRRDYVWTVDTIRPPKSDYFFALRIWGGGPDDVWMIGMASSSSNMIWHFDGVRWQPLGLYLDIAPYALFGFSPNDVWLGNTNATFWRYNGSNWSLFSRQLLPGYEDNVIQNINGPSATDLYGVGVAVNSTLKKRKGIIMQFDGNRWTYLTLPDNDIVFADVRYQKTTGLLLLEGFRSNPQSNSQTRIFTYNGKEIGEVFSTVPWGASVNNIGDEVYIVANHMIYKLSGGKPTLWKDLSGTSFLGKVWGRSEKDFFSFASGGIGHYNGTDFQTIFQVDSSYLAATGIVFAKEVFFACNPLAGDIVLVAHGKLPIDN